jgi:hypothetical protein
MPILTTTNNSLTLQGIVNFLRTYPELVPILGTTGYSTEPALTLANDVMQRIFAQGMDWKWNRALIPSFLTVALQQDYLTQVSDVGWLESVTRVDINNNTNNGNLAMKPEFTTEAVRDLNPQSLQGSPFDFNVIPNKLAILGTWQPNTVYSCGYGVAQTPITPVQQFMDANGNLLYIDSTVLGLNRVSPGFTGDTISLTNSPYGVSGSTQPSLPTLSAPGTTVQDGSVIWTVADPDGAAVRMDPVPAICGLCWLIYPVYQRNPPVFVNLQSTIYPLPNNMAYLFRQGLKAYLMEHAGSAKAAATMAGWETTLMTALRAADREQENFVMYPSSGLMESGSYYGGAAIGPGWPFGG